MKFEELHDNQRIFEEITQNFSSRENYASEESTPQSPLEFVFQEQSYCSLHSGRSLAWDNVRGDIDDPCGAIANFCIVSADPYGPVALSLFLRRSAVARLAMPIVARLAKHHETLLNIVKIMKHM